VVEVCGDYTERLWAHPQGREVTLELTGRERLLGLPEAIGRELRNRLRGELGLECSIGVGTSPTVAQLASRTARPGEVLSVPAKAAAAFVGRAPVAALPGVEAEWARWLSEMGIRTVGDLGALSVETVVRTFGERGRRAWEAAQGGEPRLAAPAPSAEEAVSAQVDLHPPSDERARLRTALQMVVAEVAGQLRQRGKATRQVRLELVFADLRQVEVRRTLPCATGDAKAVFQVARDLVDRVRLHGKQVRRIRLSVGHLVLDEQGGQLPLPLPEAQAGRPRQAPRAGRFQPARAVAS
jgi:DNA polymerase-4